MAMKPAETCLLNLQQMIGNSSQGKGVVGQWRGIHKTAVVLLNEGGVQLCCNEGWMGGQALQKGLVSG